MQKPICVMWCDISIYHYCVIYKHVNMHNGAPSSSYIVLLQSYINIINLYTQVSVISVNLQEESCQLFIITYIFSIKLYIHKTSFSHQYPLCDFSNVVVSGHTELLHPLAPKVTFMKTHWENLVTIWFTTRSSEEGFSPVYSVAK